MKLYDLSESYANIQNLLDAEGTDQESLKMALSVIETEIQAKAQNVAHIIRQMDADAEAIKAEEKRLADRKRAIENRIRWLKDYLKDQMEMTNTDKIKTATMTISIQNNPPSVSIVDDKAIPAKFLTIIPEQYVPDKKAISAAIKGGEDVPGAELTQGKSLRIR